MTPLKKQKLNAARFHYQQLLEQLMYTLDGLHYIIIGLLWRNEGATPAELKLFDPHHPRFESYRHVVTDTSLSFDDETHNSLLEEYLYLLTRRQTSWIHKDLAILISEDPRQERQREEVVKRGQTWEGLEERLQFRVPFWDARRECKETCRGIWAMLQEKARLEDNEVNFRERVCGEGTGLRRVRERQTGVDDI
ncbi:hypothetical protein BDD12DRAFT_840681 [Trichophaea hybrida]|nr:hypothetical protein BDD12DRAFT_840681 [Trichophaea hybrida]